MTTPPGPVTVGLLADHPHLIEPVGLMRWREWGRPPEPEEPAWWVETTAREAGRDGLPVTWVAVDRHGEAVGAVGLGRFDLDELQDRSPWVLGMIVRPDRRGLGIGRLLLSTLEAWAASHGHERLWVATGDQAIDFYRACTWEHVETVKLAAGDTALILTKRPEADTTLLRE